MLSLPSPLLRTHPPPSRLSVHFVFRLIEPTCSCRFRQGRGGLPQLIAPLSLSVSPLIPRHRPFTSQPVSVKGFCLRPLLKGSASGAYLFRGYFYVHVSYDPDSRSSRLAGLCRWASEGSVSPSPCHPSYIALASTMTGLPPARLRYPSLGTPRIESDPQSPAL